MKKSLLLTLCLMMSVLGFAQGQLSNYTRLFLEQHKSGQQAAPVGSRRSLKTKSVISPSGVETVDCFISLKKLSLSDLQSKGVEVNAIYGDLVSATVPVDSIESLAQLNSVKQVNISRQRRLLTDVARETTQVQSVHAFDAAAREAGLTQAYTGQGVVLGIIDDGIQFNHTAFKDANGNTRIKAAYLPNATSPNGGTKKMIDGVTLLGYQYITATEIGRLTTDDKYESHGTHTAGCAGGSLVGLYSGMAPEVDLVLCGCGDDLSDRAISNSAKYIANYAKEQGKPCVISISLGSNTGPHDGTSDICQVYDQIAEDYGAIILLAAGNEADLSGSVKKTLTSESNYMAVGHEFISPTTGYSIDGDVDFWNSTGDELQMQVVVLNSSGKAVYTSSKMSNGTISSSSLSSYFSNSYFSTGIRIAGSRDSKNGRYNLTATATLGNNKGNYKLCYVVYGKAGNTITGWTDCYYTQFTANVSGSAYTKSDYSFTAGTGSHSLCDDVTGRNTISVGAYASRLSIPGNHGSTTYSLSNDPFAEHDIAYFSSYGTDFNGVQHPFVTAPGHAVVSSVNRYNVTESYTGYSTMDAYRVSIGSNTYDYWEYMSGTSMATPVAAGVVALYLQADPSLTLDAVKQLIQQTAIRDIHTSTHAERFGAGKINALGGVAQLVGTQEPSLRLSHQSLLFTGYAARSYTQTVKLSGQRLKSDVNLSLSDASGAYEVSPATISPVDAENGVEVTVRWTPLSAGETNATISFSTEGAETQVLNLTACAVEEGTAADACLDIAKYATIDDAGWNRTYVNTLYQYTEHKADHAAWLTLPVYGVWSSIYYEPRAQKWVETNITSTSNAYAGLTWAPSGACLGNTVYFTKPSGVGAPRAIGYNAGGNVTEETITFYVTNTTAVQLLGLGQSKTSSDYPAALEIYECTKSDDGTVTAGERIRRLTSDASSGTFLLTATELDATGTYKVVASTYRSMLCEIAFQTPLTAATDYAMGDTNMDGSVDISDVVLTVNHVLGSADQSAHYGVITYGDMNADGSIDISDVVAIVNTILGDNGTQE